jgi:hypothetical protein
MILGFSTLFIAICISIVAAYYSILGLVAIFAAAFLPIVIMGGALEAGKVMATVWLHRNWHRAGIQYKLYLVPAVFMLMFLTSMGIFGFLSKAHIDQTTGSQESVAQVQRITTEIGRQKGIIERAEDRLKKLETVGTGVDANVQGQINTEQQRIDGALARIKPAIDEQNQIIASQTKLYTDQIDRIDEQLNILQRYIDTNEIAKAQSMIGTPSDGNWGPGTATAVRVWQTTKNRDRAALVNKLEALESNNPAIAAARREITRLRSGADTQIAESNTLITRLRTQLGKTSSEDANQALTEQQTVIRDANTEIDTLTQKKYQLEAEYRRLEAEVGPVKYIAEFIYGDQADKNTLEQAVRWVILLIVAVFDPLALVLILAGTKQIEWARRSEEIKTEQQLVAEQNAALVPELQDQINRHSEETTRLHQTIGALTTELEATRVSTPSPAPDLSEVNAELQTVTPEIDHEVLLTQSQAEPQTASPGVDYEALLTEAQARTQMAAESQVQLKAQLTEVTTHAEQLMQEYFNKELQYKELLTQLEQLNQDQEIQATLLANALQRNQDADEQRHHAYTVLEQRNQEITALNQRIAELTRTPEPELEPIQETASTFKFVTPPVPETAPKFKAPVEPEYQPTYVAEVAIPEPDPVTEPVRPASAGFGSEFPSSPAKGDMFLRTDFKPSRLFKWNDQQWIQINKNTTDAYAYNDQYIEFLITKLQDREYEWEELTPTEQQQVEAIMGGPFV